MTKEDAWIMTYTGRKVFPFAFTEDQIDIHDIAHALAHKCRFTGHCRKFYSVAEHSVLCAAALAGTPFEREALMHDAAEYILPDIARPIKPYFPGFKELEHQIESIIARRFRLMHPWSDQVHEVDLRMVVTEGFLLMPDISEWDIDAKRVILDSPLGMSPEDAEAAFLDACEQLGIK